MAQSCVALQLLAAAHTSAVTAPCGNAYVIHMTLQLMLAYAPAGAPQHCYVRHMQTGGVVAGGVLSLLNRHNNS